MPKPNNAKPIEGGGFTLELPGPGRNLIQRGYATQVVKALNALGHIEITQPATGAAKVIYSDLRTVLQIPQNSRTPTGSELVNIKRARITALAADYVTADLWDETANDFDGDSITVAKPYELRNNPTGTEWSVAWTYAYASAQERTRTAAGYAATKQRVYPDYKVNDEIIVLFNDEHTGVAGATEYLDLNVDARRWLTETEGCGAEGGPVYAFMDRSPFAASAVGSNFA